MNDIGNVLEFLYTILYSDDTCVLLNGKDYFNLIATLNSELDNYMAVCKQDITKCSENLFDGFSQRKIKNSQSY